jgi:hypothetical protein
MPGLPLQIGETNPKKGAVQFDGRRIDGVPFVIPTGAGVTSAPIGSVVTLQEYVAGGQQRIVLGAEAYTDGSGHTYTIIGIGFLEAATQTSDVINQNVGEYSSGDMASMISDVAAVASVPMLAGHLPSSGFGAYISADGKLTNSDYGTVAFPGYVFFTTAGAQLTNQLKSGYCFARLAVTMLIDSLLGA